MMEMNLTLRQSPGLATRFTRARAKATAKFLRAMGRDAIAHRLAGEWVVMVGPHYYRWFLVMSPERYAGDTK